MDYKIEYFENNRFNRDVKERTNLIHDAHDLCLNTYLNKRHNDLGLKSEYQKNEELVKWFKNICCLSLIPIESVDSQFESILNSMPEIDKVSKFMDYLVNTYFEGSLNRDLHEKKTKSFQSLDESLSGVSEDEDQNI
ncbi:hypothetical protein BpHYR1_046639 [Brachionus plicatilis]|uniref:Uncharacterized protein n=1 Tax=Brachionus plicatilis TaxID=10195 RepID=A0A3M7SV95_BRAPC|nr:hypothetical protein BpHYR1_046639 [Brachionus plicatilis]